jgi:hypothetical protein
MGAGTAAAAEDRTGAEGTGCTSADLADNQVREESMVPEQSSGSRPAEGIVLGDIVLEGIALEDSVLAEDIDPEELGSASCQAGVALGTGPAVVAAGLDRQAWAPSGSPRRLLR